MKTCIYPGSFDPFTVGHFDLLLRATQLFDQVVVGVLANREKRAMFSAEQRVEWIGRCIEAAGLADRSRAEVFSGLTVDFGRKCGAVAILRGLRSALDLEYELPIAQMNREMAPSLDTVFILSDGRYGHVASSLVKDVGLHGGQITYWVPPAIADDVQAALTAVNQLN